MFWVFLLVVTDRIAHKKKDKEGKDQDVQKGCYVKIAGLSYVVCAKMGCRAKLALCGRCLLLQFRSECKRGQF